MQIDRRAYGGRNDKQGRLGAGAGKYPLVSPVDCVVLALGVNGTRWWSGDSANGRAGSSLLKPGARVRMISTEGDEADQRCHS